MKVGVHVASFTWPGGSEAIAPMLAEMARAVDEAGASYLTVMDHLFQLEAFAPAEEPMLEGYTTLGYLAGITSRVELHLLVTGVTYRYPGFLAKVVSTLDVLSQGRARLGIGAAWYDREHTGLGIPFPPMAERFERLEETLQICQQMWSGEGGAYQGRHHQLTELLDSPPPLRKPPILIGGSGEKKTLRLVAKYADACNLFVGTAEEATHKLDVLRRHCETEGTDFDRIEKTILHMGRPPQADPAGFVAAMKPLAEAGIEGVYVMPFDAPPDVMGRTLDEIVPALAEL